MLEIFRRMCLIRYFELEVVKAYKAGVIHTPVYLSIGQEAIPATLSVSIPTYKVFAQHRAHGTYLAYGGDPVKLIDELLGRPTGCTHGIGGSPMLQSESMIGHHGLIGENVPLAVGYALGSGKQTLCLFGDGAAEEDYVLSSMGFAATHRLPVLFVCEDNGLSILTKKEVRRSWGMADVVKKGFGLDAIDTPDEPYLIQSYVEEMTLPAFINIYTTRHYWHVGVGTDGPPKQDSLAKVRRLLGLRGKKTEAEAKQFMENLWVEQLQKQ